MVAKRLLNVAKIALGGFLRDLRSAQQAERERWEDQAQAYGEAESAGAPPPPAPPPPGQAAPAATTAAAPAKDAAEESATNVQHACVDEGGIVKLHRNHLVVLRRGKLFTIEIGNGELTPISTIDAFSPGIDPSGTWYDEMLLANDTIVVIGFSYQRGGTELGLFDIDQNGRLSHRATYHLRSNDYYSSRNYASRLIGCRASCVDWYGNARPLFLRDRGRRAPRRRDTREAPRELRAAGAENRALRGG